MTKKLKFTLNNNKYIANKVSRYIKAGLLSTSLLAASIHSALAAQAEVKQPGNTDSDSLTVTAQKREQAAEQVPFSLAVITDKAILHRHLERTEDVVNQAVNMNMGTLSGSLYDTFVQMRGVGSNIIDIDPSVGMFVDNAPVTNSQAYSFGLLDVQRVELLRGPQGTLYGRNTLGGAINIVTNKPEFGTTRFEGGIETGNYAKTRLHGILNSPLGSHWALRVAGAAVTSSTMTHNSAKDQPDTNKITGGQLRLSLQGYATDNLEMLTVYEHSQQNPRDTGYMTEQHFLAGNSSVNIDNPSSGKVLSDELRHYFTVNFDNGSKLVTTTSLTRNHFDMNGSGFPAGLFVPLDMATAAGAKAAVESMFTQMTPSMTGTFELKNYRSRINNPYTSTFKMIAQEVRFESSNDTRLQWLAGVYGEYSDATRNYGAVSSYKPSVFTTTTPPDITVPFLNGDSVGLSFTGRTKTGSVALFGDASLDVTDKLQIFSGLRAGYDNKKFDYRFAVNSVDAAIWKGSFYAAFLDEYQATQSSTYFMPRVGLRYQLTDNAQSYLNISRGFKSGGFNTATVIQGQRLSYGNENLMSYELGVKSDLIHNHLSLNAALFYIDRHNQQVQNFDPVSQNIFVSNAPKSRSYGGELTLSAALDEHLSGYAGLGYTDATYLEFPNAALDNSGAKPLPLNASQRQQQYISRITANIGVGYSWNISSSLKGRGDIGYQYRSAYYFDPINTQKQPGYGLLNARLSAGNAHFQVYVWGNNLTNQRYRASASDFGPLGRIVSMGELRTFGIGISGKI